MKISTLVSISFFLFIGSWINISCAQKTDDNAILVASKQKLQRLENDLTLLGNISDSSNWQLYKKDISDNLLDNRNISITNDLKDEYKTIDTIKINEYLNLITSSFIDGFNYKLNLNKGIIFNKKILSNNQITLDLHVPRSLQGILKKNIILRHNDTVSFNLTISKSGDKITKVQINSIKAFHGTPNSIPISFETIYNIKDSLAYYVKLLSRSTNNQETERLKKRVMFFLSDTIITVERKSTKTIESFPIDLFLQRLELQKNAKIEIRGFDVEYLTNFYQDVDEKYYADRTILRKVALNVDDKKKYQEKKEDVIRVDKKTATDNKNKYRIFNLVFYEE